ncbi:MAG: 50S ribosomal protein L15 [Thermofilaceae archaeon]|nr:50S ribosomal protein L15 [Thermofilaceae archaeon]MCX8180622.1 50S ribosomal protein L15 [Thermofilaceae archaeon]MDW8003724.1 uL15 family ribosomal protein [Thermofilaceae archaeon]
MTVRREKKSKYFRGSRTYGWGRVAQHRRSGRKGGRGRVGYHKHKWSWVVKYAKEWYGKHGFTRHPSLVKRKHLINIGEIDEMVEELIKLGMARMEGDSIYVNIAVLGYNKLGGKGKVSKKLVVEGPEATDKAIRKLEKAGGTFLTIKGGES